MADLDNRHYDSRRSRDVREPRRRSRSPYRRRSRSRSPHRGRSRSRSPDYDPNRPRRRPTWFDIPPVGGAPPPVSQLPGAVQVVTEAEARSSMAGSGAAYMAASSQQATRHARRVYVGGIMPGTTEEQLTVFFSNALAAIGGTVAGPGSCVLSVYVNHEKKFAFVELRTVEETSNACSLDGIMFGETVLRVKRPADYNAAAAASLGPSQPNPNLNLSAIGLERRDTSAAATATATAAAGAASAPSSGAMPAGHPDAAHRIFVGGLPYYLTEEQVRELLGSFGTIKSLDLIRDRETQQFKGYCFVVYEDPAVTDIACAGLHGMKMGDRHLTVRLANEGQRLQEIARQPGGEAPNVPRPPRVVKLSEAVTPEELVDDGEYADILEDMQEECSKYGRVIKVEIPRPGPPAAPPTPGVGKVLIEFEEASSAVAARNALHGKKFSGRTVVASLISDEDWQGRNWD